METVISPGIDAPPCPPAAWRCQEEEEEVLHHPQEEQAQEEEGQARCAQVLQGRTPLPIMHLVVCLGLSSSRCSLAV